MAIQEPTKRLRDRGDDGRGAPSRVHRLPRRPRRRMIAGHSACARSLNQSTSPMSNELTLKIMTNLPTTRAFSGVMSGNQSLTRRWFFTSRNPTTVKSAPRPVVTRADSQRLWDDTDESYAVVQGRLGTSRGTIDTTGRVAPRRRGSH
jgi:hypothetical protein